MEWDPAARRGFLCAPPQCQMPGGPEGAFGPVECGPLGLTWRNASDEGTCQPGLCMRLQLLRGQ